MPLWNEAFPSPQCEVSLPSNITALYFLGYYYFLVCGFSFYIMVRAVGHSKKKNPHTVVKLKVCQSEGRLLHLSIQILFLNLE